MLERLERVERRRMEVDGLSANGGSDGEALFHAAADMRVGGDPAGRAPIRHE